MIDRHDCVVHPLKKIVISVNALILQSRDDKGLYALFKALRYMQYYNVIAYRLTFKAKDIEGHKKERKHFSNKGLPFFISFLLTPESSIIMNGTPRTFFVR